MLSKLGNIVSRLERKSKHPVKLHRAYVKLHRAHGGGTEIHGENEENIGSWGICGVDLID